MNVYQEKRRALGQHCPGFGSKSSSQSNPQDNRVTAGTVGISGSGNAVNITDGGIVARSLDTVDKVVGTGFTELLDTAEGLIGRTQTLVADAYAQADANKSQTIDNRTLIVLALAAAAVLVAINWKR